MNYISHFAVPSVSTYPPVHNSSETPGARWNGGRESGIQYKRTINLTAFHAPMSHTRSMLTQQKVLENTVHTVLHGHLVHVQQTGNWSVTAECSG